MEIRRENKKDMQKRFPMTINKSLFQLWQKCKRKNDSVKLMEICGKSRPIIDRALNYGHVKDDEVIAKITEYFTDRANTESAKQKELASSIS